MNDGAFGRFGTRGIGILAVCLLASLPFLLSTANAPDTRWRVAVFPIALVEPVDAAVRERLLQSLRSLSERGNRLVFIEPPELAAFDASIRTTEDYCEAIREKLRTGLSADFILLARLSSWGKGSYKLETLAFSAHTGKFLAGPTLYGDVDSIAKGVHSEFATLDDRFPYAPKAVSNALIERWDRELALIPMRPPAKTPTVSKRGSLVAVPAGAGYPYWLYLPAGIESSGESYPLLVFLHGYGEVSPALSAKVFAGSPLASVVGTKDGSLSKDASAWSALDPRLSGSIVLVPQHGPGDDGWNENAIHDAVMEVLKKYPVDRKRLYVTGISMGGSGAWNYAATLWNKVAAVVPISGGGDVSRSEETYRSIAVWAFHSFDDPVLDPWSATNAVLEDILPGMLVWGDRNIMQFYPYSKGDPTQPAATDCTIWYDDGGLGAWEPGLVGSRGRIGFTMFRSGGHDAWTRAYKSSELWTWLYAQSK